MVDEVAPEISPFDLALQELAAEIARMSPVQQKEILDRAQVRPGQLPHMPALPPRREARPSLSPEVDAFMGATGLPTSMGSGLDTAYQIGEAGPRQMQKAEGAVRNALADPSVGNIANAGTQTGMAVMRPAIALPSLALQYGNAAAQDLGLFDTSANAQAPLKRSQEREMEMERRRREGQAEVDRRAEENRAKLGREDADATSKRELAAEVARKERDEYDRAVLRAEEMRQAELDKRRAFRDTAVGKAYDETGGAAPFALGAVSGFAQRAMGPVTQSKLLKWGAGGGAAASNLPSFADAYIVPPVENPDQRAASVYARELPPSHPRKDEWLTYAKDEQLLPKLNPTRATAKEEFTDTVPAIKRNIGGAIEGAVGAEIGMATFGAPARFFNALGRGARDLIGRPGQVAPASQGASAAIPQGETPAILSTLGPASSLERGRVVDRMSAGRNALAGPETPQRQLPPPEASASQSALPETRIIMKSRGKDGVTRLHGDKGRFTTDPRKSVDE